MKKQRLLSIVLVFAMVLTLVPLMPSTVKAAGYDVVAHWKFDDSNAANYSGQLNDNSLKILDLTGNGNDLEINTTWINRGTITGKFASDYLAFQDRSILSNGAKSINFTPTYRKGVGAFFNTVSGAPMTDEEFRNGYTIEAIYMEQPGPSSATQPNGSPVTNGNHLGDYRWASIFGKRGTAWSAGIKNLTGDRTEEGEETEVNGGLNLTDSGSLQLNFFTTAIRNTPKTLSYQATTWGDLYELNKFHYAVIKNDGATTTLYVDGLPVQRNNRWINPQNGIDKLDGGGWAVGAGYWYDGNGTLADSEASMISSLFGGNIQEIRVSKGVVPDSNLIIPNYAGITPDAKFRSSIGNNDSTTFVNAPRNYNIAFIPDSQYAVQYTDIIFKTQLEWLKNNYLKNNIAINAHLGDITENDEIGRQWAYVNDAYKQLDDAGVPYIVSSGNHDLYNRTNTTFFKDTFRASRQNENWYWGDIGPNGHSRYAIVRGGSYNYLVLSIGWQDGNVDNADLTWAQTVLTANSDLPTILFSHSGSSLPNSYPQIFLNVYGHINGSSASTTNIGSTGCATLRFDYQDEAYSGNGWLNMLEFDESANTITVRTYSPWVEKKIKEFGLNSAWWNALDITDKKLHSFDVKNLNNYTGTGTFNANQTVINIDFAARFAGLSKYTPTADDTTARNELLTKIGDAQALLQSSGNTYSQAVKDAFANGIAIANSTANSPIGVKTVYEMGKVNLQKAVDAFLAGEIPEEETPAPIPSSNPKPPYYPATPTPEPTEPPAPPIPTPFPTYNPVAGTEPAITTAIATVPLSSLPKAAQEAAAGGTVVSVRQPFNGMSFEQTYGVNPVVSQPYSKPSGVASQNVVVFRVGDDGALKPVALSNYKGGKAYFEPNEFGNYVVMAVAPASLNDVTSDHANAKAIETVIARGILTTDADGNFSPDKTMTVAETLTALSRLAGFDIAAAEGDDWSSSFMEWATENEILPPVSLDPNGDVTLEQLAYMINALSEYIGKVGSKSKVGFDDADAISEWAAEAIARLSRSKIIEAGDDNTINPDSTVTRAEAAEIMSRLISYIVK